MHTIGHLILRDVLLILYFQFVVGDLHALAKLRQIDQSVFNGPFLGNLRLAFALLVGFLDFGLRRGNFGFEVLRLDQRVVELQLFVLIAELLHQLVGAGADTIGYQPAKLLFQESLFDQVFEHWHGHSKTLLHLLRVLIHSHGTVAIKSCRQELLYAVRNLFVRNFDSQAVRFVLNFFRVYQLRQDLPGIEPFEGLGHLIAALNFAELLAHLGQRDGLVPNLCHRVVGFRIRSRSCRQQVAEHADSKHPDHSPEKNSDSKFSLIKCSSLSSRACKA